MMDKILTPKQLAEMLGNSTKILAYWRHTGTGPKFFKLQNTKQGQTRYRLSDVNAWIESQIRNSTSDPGGII